MGSWDCCFSCSSNSCFSVLFLYSSHLDFLSKEHISRLKHWNGTSQTNIGQKGQTLWKYPTSYSYQSHSWVSSLVDRQGCQKSMKRPNEHFLTSWPWPLTCDLDIITIDRIALAKQGDTLINLVKFICPSVCLLTLCCLNCLILKTRNSTIFQDKAPLYHIPDSISTMIGNVHPCFEPWTGRFSHNTHQILTILIFCEGLAISHNLRSGSEVKVKVWVMVKCWY